jgi:hypothetical protein
MKKTIFAWLLIFCLLITGCGAAENAAKAGTTAAEQTTAVETEAEIDRASIKDSLPDNLDFEGRTFNIFFANGFNWDSFIDVPEQTGDVVEDAVYTANQTVQERLNVNIGYKAEDKGDWSTISGIVQTYILAGDPTYDVFMGEQYGLAQIVSNGYFVNANELDYFDFDAPWWNHSFMENLSIGKDIRYFITGDYNLTTLNQAFVLYYNRALYEKYYADADGLYEEVFDGKWTLDRLCEIAKGAFIDLDNDGKTTEADQLGFLAYLTYSTVDPFMYCADIPYATRDENGYFTINMNQERATTLIEKLIDVYYQEGSCCNPKENVNQTFASGTVMFLSGLLGGAGSLRDMTDDFGILPYPKLDDTQNRYSGMVGDCVLLCAIPVTSQNTDIAGAVMEALNAETYRYVTPAWYETALKIKYSRGSSTTEMIDLIRDSMTTNFIFAYSPVLANVGQVMRGLVTSKSTDYMSAVAKLEKPAEAALQKLIAAFESN